jgi:hypothetical protein
MLANISSGRSQKPTGKRKAKEELHSFCQNTTRDKGQNYFEMYYRNGSSPWFNELTMKSRAFASINRMTAGHTSLEASLKRFNIVSTAECECGDGPQMEQHIFWDCKLYEDQRATMMDILPQNRKKEYPNTITELLRLEEKRFVQGVFYFINKQKKVLATGQRRDHGS